jgi:hypothetical protein
MTEARPLSLSLLKINSKWIKDLNVTPEMLKLPEENTSRCKHRTPTAQEIRVIIDQWDCIKFKNVFKENETITKGKRQHTEWKKIFTRYLTRD